VSSVVARMETVTSPMELRVARDSRKKLLAGLESSKTTVRTGPRQGLKPTSHQSVVSTDPRFPETQLTHHSLALNSQCPNGGQQFVGMNGLGQDFKVVPFALRILEQVCRYSLP
jgi:hypothetical protein